MTLRKIYDVIEVRDWLWWCIYDYGVALGVPASFIPRIGSRYIYRSSLHKGDSYKFTSFTGWLIINDAYKKRDSGNAENGKADWHGDSHPCAMIEVTISKSQWAAQARRTKVFILNMSQVVTEHHIALQRRLIPQAIPTEMMISTGTTLSSRGT